MRIRERTLRHILFVVAFIALVCTNLSRHANALSAGELLANCEQLERIWIVDGNRVGFQLNDASAAAAGSKCWGYLNAYLDVAYVVLVDPEKPNDRPTRPLGSCLPKGIGLVQLIRMFLQHARAHPADLHESAYFMLANMLMKNFPCRE